MPGHSGQNDGEPSSRRKGGHCSQGLSVCVLMHVRLRRKKRRLAAQQGSLCQPAEDPDREAAPAHESVWAQVVRTLSRRVTCGAQGVYFACRAKASPRWLSGEKKNGSQAPVLVRPSPLEQGFGGSHHVVDGEAELLEQQLGRSRFPEGMHADDRNNFV